MRHHRPYRLFSGVAYPNVIPGKNPTRKVSASVDNRDELYYDPAIRLSHADLDQIGSIVGKPICFEHDSENVVGEIIKAWTDDEHKLRINARIFTDIQCGQLAWNELKSGNLAQLSVGYRSETTYDSSGNAIVGPKHFDEVSLVRRGFFPGAEILVSATTNQADYKSNQQRLTFNIATMASAGNDQTSQPTSESVTPAAVSTPSATPAVDPIAKTGSELLKQTDNLQRQVDELQRQNQMLKQPTPEQIEKERLFARLLKEEEERQKQYQEEGLRKMQETLKAQEELLGSSISDNYKRGMEPVFASKELAEPARIMYETVSKGIAEKRRADELMVRLSATEARLKQLESTHMAAANQLKDTHGQIMGLQHEQQQTIDVNASGNSRPVSRTPTTLAGSFSQIYIPAPSANELELMQQEGLGSFRRAAVGGPIKVTASEGGVETRTIDALPEHSYSKAVPNSLRLRFKETAPMWTHAFMNPTNPYDGHTKLRVQPFSEMPRKDPGESELLLSDPTRTLPMY